MSFVSIPSYAPLWCKSNYSFLEGASHPEELIEEAHQLGLRSLVLTDRDGVYGVVRGHMKARELGFHLVLGAQVTLDDGSILPLLVMNREGYANLCHLLTIGRLRRPKGESEVTWTEVCEHAEGLIALWGGDGSLLTADADPLFIARDLVDAFAGRIYALVVRHRRAGEMVLERRVRERAARYGLPIVAGQEVLYHTPARKPLQDVVTCIRHGVTLATAGMRTKPNAEHALKSPHAFAILFQDDIAAVGRTLEVVSRCSFTLDEIRYRYPSEKLPDGTTSTEWLRHLTFEGAKERYSGAQVRFETGVATEVMSEATVDVAATAVPLAAVGRAAKAEPEIDAASGPDTEERVAATQEPRARIIALPQRPKLTLEAPAEIPAAVVSQIEKELHIIRDLEYDGYFLTMWEIVQFCRREGILCQGRGSAANSAVCFCLGITAIDPVRMGLLFERFLSRERAEPPDIDLDIEHDRREEVIQWVYRKYGRTHAAMVANFIRFRVRSALREVGKVLGFAETELDRLAKVMPHYESITPNLLHQAGFDAANAIHQHLLVLTLEIQDFPRHLSIHPGGFLLGHEPIARLVPTENATMADRTVIQWDKEDIENLELFKVDLLGLGALRQLHLAFDLLRQHWGREYSMATIPPDDEETFLMIQRSDTIGVFQIESRAQMAMLPRLKPVTYYDLVIEVSIVRPGPISGGMVHPYLRRRSGQEVVVYPHPSLKPVLQKTLGVPLFQEQVMQLAVVAADYTPGEADQLRRDMAAWRSSGRIDRHRERLISRMTAKGIEEEFAQRVFEQIRGFGEYGFPESHAASFALIAYATAWVRRRYIEAFTCALLNAQPMGFYTPATIVEDARRHGAVILPVDVMASAWDCTLERMGETGTAGIGIGDEALTAGIGAEIGVGTGTGTGIGAEAGTGAGTGTGAEAEAGACVGVGAGAGAGGGDAVEAGVRNGINATETSAGTRKRRRSFAIRLGYRYVKGFGARERAAIESAQRDGPFVSIEDFARRTRIAENHLHRLAEAGAFRAFEPRRRNAVWLVRALHHEDIPALEVDSAETPVSFQSLGLFETIAWDYEASSLSTLGHPLLPLRRELRRQGLPEARVLNAMTHGRRVRYAGIVINRQRPGTAGGVTFMTLEDETGFVNLVVWLPVWEQHRLLIKTAPFLGVTGKLQVESGVVHLIAEDFWIPEVTEQPRSAGSRDFH